jgi:hypothetical protein
MSGAKWPARYEVRVDGVLDGRWSEWFAGPQIDNRGGETLLSGTLPDQPALHGILEKVRDLGLSIIAVRRIPPQGEAGEQPMRRIRVQRPKSKRKRRWLEALTAEPRDPEIVRAKALERSPSWTSCGDSGRHVTR